MANWVCLRELSYIPRGSRNIGKIIETYPLDSDKFVRVVKVQTKSGKYLIPINRLCLLEEEKYDEKKSVNSE